MKIDRKSLDGAVDERIITADQADLLLDYLAGKPSLGPSFNVANVLYYLGGLIAIGAMTLFMTLGWESFGGWGIVVISLLYAAGGLKLADAFQAKGYAIPAGICVTFVVALTPLAIYGLQQALGLWPDDSTYRDYHRYIKWHWLFMEIATLVAGVMALQRYKYPFLMLPIAVTLWYMSMDVASMITGIDTFEYRALVSMCIGILIIMLAFWVDVKSNANADYAFWLYIFGVMAFWCGLSAQSSDSELSKFFYLCINLLMIALGVVINRRVFVVFGAIGTCLYLGHLAHDVFENSWLFPIALTIIGLMIVFLGVKWQQNERQINEIARSLLPAKLKRLLDAKIS